MTRISWLAALAGLASSPCSPSLAAMRRRRAWMQRREQRKLPYRGGRDPRRCPLLRWARRESSRFSSADGGDAVFVAFGVGGIVALGIAFSGLREILSGTWSLVRFEHRVV
jgi:hypothetical protein